MFRQNLILSLCLISSMVFAAEKPSIRYVALGDSYTVGTGAQLDESWPVLIAKRLQKEGLSIELVGNLGRNGWTSQNLIDYELPQLRILKPNFVTILIGANDFVQGVNDQTYQKHITYILDELLKILSDSKHIIVITIPDFSVVPVGKEFSQGRDITRGIQSFNQIMIQEAQLRGIKTVDLYPLSQTMGKDSSLIAQDGLHPSAIEYAKWADLIKKSFQFP
jgi:lysophospholipase L1-like esterase